MHRSLIGPALRERRRALGITQAGLAAQVGISASYLNLIESDKRNIGGALLQRLASALEVDMRELDGASERRLLDDLGELVAEPLLADLHLDPRAAHALASTQRPWAHALVRLHRAWTDRGQAVSALSDRLNQDPFLAGAVHSMLTQVAAIRSASEILETVEDLAPAQRQRFTAIVGNESARLAEVAKGLATFFAKDFSGTRSLTPVDEVDDFFFDHDNHFDALEEAAQRLRHAAGLADPCDGGALIEHLQRAHGVRVVGRPAQPGDGLAAGTGTGTGASLQTPAVFDRASRTLTLAEGLAPPTVRLELARLAAELADEGRAVDEVLAQATQLATDAARRRARRALTSYLAAATLLPYESFLATARQLRYDIERLASRTRASIEQVCHRLATLRRPGATGIPFAFMRIDAAGFTSKRLPIPQLAVPRHAQACPMWAIYQAQHAPGTLLRQLAEFPSGARLLFIACTVEKARPAFIQPRRLVSIMLACDALLADQTVYGDGLDLSSTAAAVPVGPNCRLCVRQQCAYRQEDPVLDTPIAAD